MKTIKKIIFTVLAVCFWIALWYILSEKVNMAIILPSPRQTLETLCVLIGQKGFWQICAHSVVSIFSGALCGVVIACAIAFLSHASTVIRYLFSPMLSLVKATPIASVIILFLVFIGRDKIPFYISLMMVVPIVASNVLKGLENISRELSEVAKSYELDFAKRWKLLYAPSLMPYFSSALKSALALSWKAGVAAEVLCTPDNTIGKMLYESRLYLEIDVLFAWTFAVVVISVIIEALIIAISTYAMGVKNYD